MRRKTSLPDCARLKKRADRIAHRFREIRPGAGAEYAKTFRDLRSASAKFKAEVAIAASASAERLDRPFYRLLERYASAFCRLGEIGHEEVSFRDEHKEFIASRANRPMWVSIIELFVGTDPEDRRLDRAMDSALNRFIKARLKILERLDTLDSEWKHLVDARKAV